MRRRSRLRDRPVRSASFDSAGCAGRLRMTGISAGLAGRLETKGTSAGRARMTVSRWPGGAGAPSWRPGGRFGAHPSKPVT